MFQAFFVYSVKVFLKDIVNRKNYGKLILVISSITIQKRILNEKRQNNLLTEKILNNYGKRK